jgi:hypothetical protein
LVAAAWLVGGALCLSGDGDARADIAPPAPQGFETVYGSAERQPRIEVWAEKLGALDIEGVRGRGREQLRLYTDSGSVDPSAREQFERLASLPADAEPHPLAERLLQLVVKAAYHFQGSAIAIVSGFRENASRHTSGEALDFRLRGVQSARLAAYLRGLPRVGVGIYTHPRTQFVHLDVRDQSYHWLDASPPGRKWREMQLRDRHAAARDATWTLESDLPL